MWWNNEVKGAMERKRDWVEGYYIQMIIVYERVRKAGFETVATLFEKLIVSIEVTASRIMVSAKHCIKI